MEFIKKAEKSESIILKAKKICAGLVLANQQQHH
jgi:hypothetical protein